MVLKRKTNMERKKEMRVLVLGLYYASSTSASQSINAVHVYMSQVLSLNGIWEFNFFLSDVIIVADLVLGNCGYIYIYIY